MTSSRNQQTLDLARRHHHAGKFAQAEALYRQVLESEPDNADALGLLGLALCQSGRAGEAIEWIGRAIEIAPRRAAHFSNLGMALNELGRREEAIAAYRRALAIQPDLAEFYYNLGVTLAAVNEWDEAAACLGRARELKPDFEPAVSGLAKALKQVDRIGAGIRGMREKIAGGSVDRVLYLQLAELLEENGEPDEARKVWREAVERWPDYAAAHWRYGWALLIAGDYGRGWAEHEWRLKVEEFRSNRRDFVEPGWDGGELGGRRILIYPEQGFGDIIHFARYVPLVAQRGGKVVLQCPNELMPVFASLGGVHELLAWGKNVPAFDVQCSVVSLPRVMRLGGPEDVPWTGAYLKSDGTGGKKFEDVFEKGKGKFKVGLAWATRANPPGRSIPLKMLWPLGSAKIQFYSLQHGAGSEEAKSPPAGMELIDLTGRIRNFGDVAAVIDGLDLVISVDTAAGQLAGAMGKRVWTLLKIAPDWRWLQEREDSPWYPTMRLFRQKRSGAWHSVVEKMAEDLVSLVDQTKG